MVFRTRYLSQNISQGWWVSLLASAVWITASLFIIALAGLLLLNHLKGRLARTKLDSVIIYIVVLFFVFLAYAFYNQAFAVETESINIWGSFYWY